MSFSGEERRRVWELREVNMGLQPCPYWGKKRSDANAGTCSDLTKLDGKYSGGGL